jgi:hypothetical protein
MIRALLKCGLLASVLSSTGCSPAANGNGGSCAGDLQIVFSPMYTAWDMEHRFQIPAVAKGVNATDVTWSASDDSLVSLAPDPTSGGVMITVAQSNPKLSVKGPAVQLTITAQTSSQCGTSTLTITPTGEEDDWHDGALRYNNGVDARPAQQTACTTDANCPAMQNCVSGQCAQKTAACTNCHGPTATNGPYNDVAHTPEQIGGFSNTDLDNLIRNGTVPQGGYFDPNVICPGGMDPQTKTACSAQQAQDKWHILHQWTMTDEELRGLIIYLRSLTPTPQQGTSNFGGQ